MLRAEIRSILRRSPKKRDLGLLLTACERLSRTLKDDERRKDDVLVGGLARVFEARVIGSGRAGALSGIGRSAFLIRCRAHGISPIQTTAGELRAESRAARKRRSASG